MCCGIKVYNELIWILKLIMNDFLAILKMMF